MTSRKLEDPDQPAIVEEKIVVFGLFELKNHSGYLHFA